MTRSCVLFLWVVPLFSNASWLYVLDIVVSFDAWTLTWLAITKMIRATVGASLLGPIIQTNLSWRGRLPLFSHRTTRHFYQRWLTLLLHLYIAPTKKGEMKIGHKICGEWSSLRHAPAPTLHTCFITPLLSFHIQRSLLSTICTISSIIGIIVRFSLNPSCTCHHHQFQL